MRARVLGLSLWALSVGCQEELRVKDSGLDEPRGTASTSGSSGALHTGSSSGSTFPSEGPARYSAGEVHSPITPHVLERWEAVVATDPDLKEDVFAKVGASSTVSSSTLYCFAGSSVDLGEHGHLEPTWSYYLGGDADGSTPFDRTTLAARSGMSAGWAISGDPSPLESELDALEPRLALVHYGTNDMGLGSTYASAMPSYYENMMALIETSVDRGVIPVLTGITRRADSASADLWVPSYNAVIRGMAQAWQIPFIDLFEAVDHLDGYGLAGDGLHLEGYSGGACVLTEEGLGHGYNIRNLIVLESFDRIRRARFEEGALDSPHPPLGGLGSPEDPWRVDRFPFVDYRSTSDSPHDAVDAYPACDSDADESGPEWTYRIDLDEETALRFIVLDRGDVDIDLHLLGDSADPSTCVDRDHRVIERTLAAGIHHLTLDSWVDGGGVSREGEYLLAILPCEDTDTSCR